MKTVRNYWRRTTLAFAFATGLASTQVCSFGQDQALWSNPNGGLWSDATNWSGGSVPSFDDIAVFDLSGSFTVSGTQPLPIDQIAIENGTVSFQMSNLQTAFFGINGKDTAVTFEAAGQPYALVNIQQSFSSSFSAQITIGSNTTVDAQNCYFDRNATLNILGTNSLWRTNNFNAIKSNLDIVSGKLEVGNVEAGGHSMIVAGSTGLVAGSLKETNLNNSGSATIGGNLASHQGRLRLSDNSKWLNAEEIHVGYGGTGSLYVSGGSHIESGGTTSYFGKTGGIGETSSGYVSIDGADSRWDMSSSLQMAHSLTEVKNGGAFKFRDGDLYYSDLRVSGVGSQSSTGDLRIGYGSLLTIDGGAKVYSGSGKIESSTPDTLVGVHVTGSDSRWEIGSDLSFVGPDGGKLLVEEGGTVFARYLNLATQGSSIMVRNGGELIVGFDSYINQGTELVVDGGHFDFSRTSLRDYRRITKIAGSLAGDVTIDGTRNTLGAFVNDFRSSSIDLRRVRLSNSGLLIGSGEIDAGLHNSIDGHVRLGANELMLFDGIQSTNEGRISNLGGTLEFGGVMYNHGQIVGRGTFSASNWVNEKSISLSGTSDVFGDVYNFDGGLVVTSANATTTFYDSVINDGEIRTSGNGNTVIFGGYAGEGRFTGTGNVFLEGDVSIGNSPAEVIIEGSLVLGSNSQTLIELGGLNTGEFDKFKIAGDFNILGSLSVALLDDFELGSNLSFLIADIGGNRMGTFQGLGEGDLVGQFSGRDLFITYTAGNGNDVALFTAVPEPSAFLLCLLPTLGLAAMRRRRG